MSTAPRTLGHLARNYPAPADGPLAAKLLTLLGFTIDEPLLLPDGTNFYRVWVEKRDGRNDGIMYMAHLPEPLKALQAKIRERLDVGGENEDPEVAAFRAAEASDPELCFHVGVLYDSLDEVEQRIADVQRDPELKDRVKIVVNRATKGRDAAIDARMAASPLFSNVDRYPYGHHGIQVFVVTDLLSGGPLGERMTIEIDYVFPGYAENLFTAVAM